MNIILICQNGNLQLLKSPYEVELRVFLNDYEEIIQIIHGKTSKNKQRLIFKVHDIIRL